MSESRAVYGEEVFASMFLVIIELLLHREKPPHVVFKTAIPNTSESSEWVGYVRS